MKKSLINGIIALVMVLSACQIFAQSHSVARRCNERLLNAIRNDFARPTIHARNLYHVSMAMYDSWAAYDTNQQTTFLGKQHGDFFCEYDGFDLTDGYTVEQGRDITIAYAAYRVMKHRFADAPGAALTNYQLDTMMFNLELDGAITTLDYSTGSPIALGNYIAEQIINYGYQDFSNEFEDPLLDDYTNISYEPINDPLDMSEPGNPDMTDPNRWQPLELPLFIDQSGNVVSETPEFLSPEWGAVTPFSLKEEDITEYERDGFTYKVYHDPGMPPMLDMENPTGIEDPYKFGYILVSIWGSHLDPTDGVLWDISPASLGNYDIDDFPTNFEDYDEFYDLINGGDPGQGRDLNPVTGEPYEPQYVPRGDYGRILAEFWADGPDSETPPGHWFTLLNYVNDHPLMEKKWKGKGLIIDDLEWDVKAYLTLGGAMHDCAIAAWGVKGWYDYLRPVSAIRYMADQGQCSDPSLPNYDPQGIPLVEDYIELVSDIDPLAGENGENVNKIKVKSWRGPDYILNPNIDEAGVGWILAENWWPYQRPTFVTPPFAGYVSGHSTFSRAAAEVMTLITGDEYFPGGIGEFIAPMNSFLVFEDGPSQDIILQWATYRDASDQCSLSRIWGGIHPPADDLPGRLIGEKIGVEAFHYADEIFDQTAPYVIDVQTSQEVIGSNEAGSTFYIDVYFSEAMDTLAYANITFPTEDPTMNSLTLSSPIWIECDHFQAEYTISESSDLLQDIDISIFNLSDQLGNMMEVYNGENEFEIDMMSPILASVFYSTSILNDDDSGSGTFSLSITFSEDMDTESIPSISFPIENPLASTLTLNEDLSSWTGDQNYVAVYDVVDANELIADIDLQVSNAFDAAGNSFQPSFVPDGFSIDTENPMVANISVPSVVNDDLAGALFQIDISFSEDMNTDIIPELVFTNADPLAMTMTVNNAESMWLDQMVYRVSYDVVDMQEDLVDIDYEVLNAEDLAGNSQIQYETEGSFEIQMKNPAVLALSANTYEVNQTDIGDETFSMLIVFDEDMDSSVFPSISFPNENPTVLSYDMMASSWINGNTFEAVFDVAEMTEVLEDIDLTIELGEDEFGNIQESIDFVDFFDIRIETITNVEDSYSILDDVKLYPNPVKDGMELIVELNQGIQNLSWSLLDQNGRLIEGEENTKNSNNQLIISTQGLSKGMYFIHLQSDEVSKVLKVEIIN